MLMKCPVFSPPLYCTAGTNRSIDSNQDKTGYESKTVQLTAVAYKTIGIGG